MKLARCGVSVAIVLLIAGGVPGAVSPAQTVGLKIVVIAGEDAVNIIQQKTAVAPIVEVRDRNDLPVPGAIVVFAIGGASPSTFPGGARTLTLTTDAAGRAAATGLSPVSSGAYQIIVTATLRGQRATATIEQTNVAASAAAGAGAAAVTGATAGAGPATAAVGADGGGGLSATTIGIIAAAAGGGALAAVKASGGGSPSSPSAAPISTSTPTPAPTPTPTPTPTPVPTTYTGDFTGQWVITTTTASSTLTTACVSTNALNGTLMMSLEPRADGTVTGTARTTGTQTEIAVTVSPFCQSTLGTGTLNAFHAVTGTTATVAFSSQSGSTGPTPAPGVGSVTCTQSTVFSGLLASGAVSGTMTFSRRCDGTNNVDGVGSVITGSGTTTFPVTLR